MNENVVGSAASEDWTLMRSKAKIQCELELDGAENDKQFNGHWPLLDVLCIDSADLITYCNSPRPNRFRQCSSFSFSANGPTIQNIEQHLQ